MAEETICRRPVKLIIDMARRTIDADVRTGQREIRIAVIEGSGFPI